LKFNRILSGFFFDCRVFCSDLLNQYGHTMVFLMGAVDSCTYCRVHFVFLFSPKFQKRLNNNQYKQKK
jgi:hypothetical protein